MKDLIAKLQLDANCALGAIWMHIDAQAARIAELEAQIAAKPAGTDKLWEAISDEQIMRIAGDVKHRNAGVWPGDVAFARAVLASTALQAPVSEVPEVNDAKYTEAEKAIGKIIFERYPRIKGAHCASITIGILEYMGLRHSALNYDQQENVDE